tara:strand:+ start:457 stop:1011 length:555 start_codon:yes stop_codon:yes gene_type:complete
MRKIIIFFFIFNIYPHAFANLKEDIILNLEKIENFSFDFEQTINKKKEKGNCIVDYPKKIFCVYNNIKKKIMVSNGKSLVIKNELSNQYYVYPLKKTPLELILDKKYLISKIKKLNSRLVDNRYIKFTLESKDQKINIFFDKKTLNLVGWQTEDIYQNLVITFISNIKINKKIDKNIFKLPRAN